MHTLPTSTAPSTPVRRRPARSYATRVATVATISAAAAVLAVLPTGPAGVPAAAPATAAATAAPSTPSVFAAAAALPAPVVNTAVVPVAHAGQTMTVVPAAAPAAASRAASAVQLALGKVGSPYRWGATGPSSFDCSGLVNWAFKQAGVELPRTSRALSRAGTAVASGDLQPGDLVFFYSPVSHVGIYIGNGQMVHASTSGKPVAVADIDGRPYHSARRI